MRGKSLILIVIALGCGLVASIGISQIMDRNGNGRNAVATDKIFVAMVDVNINEPLTPQMIKLEEWPKNIIPDGAIRKLEDVEGFGPRTRLYAGEPILKSKLIDPLKGVNVSQTIPEGYRAMAIKVTADTVVANLIQPGDRVDVLVYLRQGRDVVRTITSTILKNIRVFAVNEQVNRETDADGNTIAAKTVTLLVTPKQVERLLLASRLGQLSLSMRRYDDPVEADDEPTSLADLLGATKETSGAGNSLATSTPPVKNNNRPANSGNGGAAGLLRLLNNSIRGGGSTPSADNPSIEVEVTEVRPQWEMVLIERDGTVRFTFDEDGEVQGKGASTPSSAPVRDLATNGPQPEDIDQPSNTDDQGTHDRASDAQSSDNDDRNRDTIDRDSDTDPDA